MIHSKIRGTGSYVPEMVTKNDDFMEFIETSDEWIVSRTGIRERRYSNEMSTVDMAYHASLEAINASGIDQAMIDLIIVATVSADNVFPGVSQMLQAKLGLKPVMAFDVNAACSGFIYAMNIADKMIQSGAYKHALVVGSEALTRWTDFRDRNTCVLFGDAAGAMIISKSDEVGLVDVIAKAQGDVDDLLICKNPGPKTLQRYEGEVQDFIHMDGRNVFKFATKVLVATVNELLERNQMTLDEIDYIVCHQANERIIDKASRDLDFPMNKMYLNISRYGNTSAASVPLAIDEAIKENKLHKGDTFMTIAFGGGLTWAGALIKY
jgi:3-oxoacyl-[acyl-carrier-protein] synthase-3